MKKKQTQNTLPEFLGINEVAPKLNKWPFKFLFSLLSYVAGVASFNKQVEFLRRRYSSDLCASCSEVFPFLNIAHSVAMPSENPIAKPGGKIIVANHEGFLLDGIFLAWMVNQYRDDFKFIATSEISFSPFNDHCFFLDILSANDKNPSRNITLYKKVIRWLKAGKIIVIFPQTHHHKKMSWSWERRLPWSNLPYMLAKMAKVPVIPIKLNVPSFYFFRTLRFMSIFFYNLRMSAMARICLIFCGIFSCIQIKFSTGKVISCVVGPELMPAITEMRGNHLRDYVYQLKPKSYSLNNQETV